MLHKDYYRKGSAEKISGRGSKWARRQDELIAGKPPVRKVTLTLTSKRFVRDSSVSRKTSFKAVQLFKTLLYLESVIIACVL
jgi:hypothetical protein